jgi:agmatine deiminase
MPAEWEAHQRCWMAWPCRTELWGDALEPARQVVADIADAIAGFEPVTMIARPDLTASVSLYLPQGVSVLPIPHDDSWTRDTGPCFLLDAEGKLGGVAFRFNGWGETWTGYAQDARMAERILEHAGARSFPSGLVLEGGAIQVDGEGTALVCESSVLDPRRNPGMSREEVEVELSQMLGLDRVIWLAHGLEDDGAGGHVENVACYARPGVVLALTTEDEKDSNFAGLQANLEVLRQATDARGRKIEVITLPQPKRRERADGRRSTMSYTSLYIANGGVIMPGFADSADKAAYRAVSTAFPGREVMQIDVTDLMPGGAGIHAITRDQPAAPG